MISDHFVEHHSLFQRVMPPEKKETLPFGSGSHGLSTEAAEALKGVFSWDYMGASQFERGQAADCMDYMWRNAKSLVATEQHGFYFLTPANKIEQAHQLWGHVVAAPDELRHAPNFENANVVGWFDFNNGFFVSRNAEMRDQLQKVLLEFK